MHYELHEAVSSLSIEQGLLSCGYACYRELRTITLTLTLTLVRTLTLIRTLTLTLTLTRRAAHA